MLRLIVTALPPCIHTAEYRSAVTVLRKNEMKRFLKISGS
jgi:hypothetical protein